MKKTFFYLFAVLFIAAFITGCSDDDKDKTPDVVGVWTYNGAKVERLKCTNSIAEAAAKPVINQQIAGYFGDIFTGPMELTKEGTVKISGAEMAVYELKESKLSIKAGEVLTLNMTISGSGNTLNGDLNMLEVVSEAEAMIFEAMGVTELIVRLTFTKK